METTELRTKLDELEDEIELLIKEFRVLTGCHNLDIKIDITQFDILGQESTYVYKVKANAII